MHNLFVNHQGSIADTSTGMLCPYSALASFLPCLSSPAPLYLLPEQVDWFRHLGQCLLAFYRAQNELYIDSVAGRAPSWVSEYLDNGKPEHIVQLGRAKAFKRELPPIIRPDVLPVHGGYSICELDSVPGGFGLAAQMIDCYKRHGHQPIGDITVEEGFVSAMAVPGRGEDTSIVIVVSDESQDYLAEMKSLSCKLLGLGYEVHVAHPRDLSYTEDSVSIKVGSRTIAIDTVYRFMELFDHRNISKWELLAFLAKGKRVRLAPAPKTYLEEKLWFALFHHPTLQAYWRSALGEEYLELLKKVIPATWILDPTPVPPHAIIPGLITEQGPAQSWDSIRNASKRGREMVIKPSGFSPNAWGSRGVVVGHDVSASDWSNVVDKALSAYPDTTYVLQEYKSPVRISLPVYTDESGSVESFVGRVRLSPYYFVEDGAAKLSAILATVCSSEKKKIHGMRDAVMTVCAV
ncbi:MAG: hypothetical protein GXP38_15795 [Chloroflexi bacterium]|nr:hypothetical protein [Chloroflexota bacterium]